jgi:hypothetical protein
MYRDLQVRRHAAQGPGRYNIIPSGAQFSAIVINGRSIAACFFAISWPSHFIWPHNIECGGPGYHSDSQRWGKDKFGELPADSNQVYDKAQSRNDHRDIKEVPCLGLFRVDGHEERAEDSDSGEHRRGGIVVREAEVGGFAETPDRPTTTKASMTKSSKKESALGKPRNH